MALNSSTDSMEVDLPQSLVPTSNVTFNTVTVSSTGGTGDFVRQNTAGGAYTASGITVSQSTPSAPTAPNSATTPQMQGLKGAITPVNSGQILLIITGYCKSSTVTAGDGISMQLSYGTGVAPSVNTTLAGTQVGATMEYTNPNTVVAADVAVPFSMQSIITGATVNTALWLDIAAVSIQTASSVSISGITITAIEL